jgi:small subunit ribosomal protein S2
VDSNSNPEGISHPVPGNDDAGRAITLYCELISRAAIDGIERAQGSAGVDLGAAEQALGEPGLDEGEGEAGEGARPPKPSVPSGERKGPRRKPGRNEARGPGNGKARPPGGRPPRKPTAEPQGETPPVAEENG